MKRVSEFGVLIGFFFLVVTLRLILLLKFPMYLDEGIYISWAKLFFESREFAYVSLNDGKTPLFMWLTAWLSPHFSSTFLTARILSAVAGAGTAVMWAVITQLLFGKKYRTWFMISALIFPYGYFVERMAFVDSLVTFFASVSFLLLLLAREAVKKISLKKGLLALVYCVLSGSVLALAYMTKTSARLFLVIHAVLVAVWIIEYCFKRKWIQASILSIGGVLTFLLYREGVGYMRVGAARFWGGILSKETELTYSLHQVLENLTTRPQMYIGASTMVATYFSVYLVGICVLILITLLYLYTQKKNWKQYSPQLQNILTLGVYCSIAIAASILVARVISSRYFYPIIPALLSFSTVGTVWLWESKQKILQHFVVFLLALTAALSVWMVVSPLTFPYAGNEKPFTQGDISALGLMEIPTVLNPEQSVVVVTGIWGVRDGSVIYLKEQGFEARGIDAAVSLSSPTKTGCTEGAQLISGQCVLLNSSTLDESNRPHKYFYLTVRTDNAELIKQLPTISVVHEFQRPSELKTYLLEYTPVTAN